MSTAVTGRAGEARGTLRDGPVVLAIITALCIRLVRLDAAPLWFDEVITARWMELGWRPLLEAVTRDNHPPLYFLLLKGWTVIAGLTPQVLRLPGVLFSTLAVACGAHAASLLVGRPTARWTAWFMALSPYLVQHGQEARMYGLVTLGAAANVASLAAWLRGARPRLGIGFVASALVLAGSHYYTVFFLGGEVLALILLWRKPVASWLPAACTTAAIGLVAFAAAVLLASHEAGGSYALGPLAAPGAVWAMIGGYAALPDSAALHADGVRAALPFLPLALGAALPVVGAALAGWGGMDPVARCILLIPFITLLAAPFAAQLVLGVAVNPRYFIAAVPGLFIWLAAGAARRPLAGWCLAVVLAIGLLQHLADPAHGREDIRAATRWLNEHVPRGEEILVTSAEMEFLARFHWPERPWRLWPPAHVVADPDNAPRLATELPPPVEGSRRIFLLGREWLTDPTGALVRAVRARYRECPGTSVRGIRILCVERDGSA
jgi:mannosyltransferase